MRIGTLWCCLFGHKFVRKNCIGISDGGHIAKFAWVRYNYCLRCGVGRPGAGQ